MFSITLTKPVFRGEAFGSHGYFIEGMQVTTTNGEVHEVPLSGFYFCTQEEKDAADPADQPKMIVEGAADELAQVETALNWLTQKYEDGIVKGLRQAKAEAMAAVQDVELPNLKVEEEVNP